MTGICKWVVFGQIMPNDLQNHLNDRWLPWKQNKRYLVHFMFSVGLKSTCNSLQNFKSLTVRVPEITGGGGGEGDQPSL